MKKAILFLTIMLFLLPITFGFEMTLSQNNIQLQPGDNYNINITFSSNENISITNIERNDSTNEIQSYFSKTAFSLNNTTENVSVLLIVSNTISPGNYTIIFKATDNNSNTNTTNLTVEIPQQQTHTNTGFHFDGTEILLGSTSQGRDTTITGTIEVFNDQNTTIENFNVTHNLNSKYQFVFTSAIPTTINPYEKFNITYTAYIPEDTDSQKTKIGEITFTSNQVTGVRPVYIQAENKLDIIDVDFTSDDGDDSNLNDGDTINVDLKPGSKAEFEIDLKNLYTDTEDIYINNAYVKITIYNIDDGDDLEIESNQEDIRAEKKKTYNLDFTIPENAEEGNYDVVIEAFGEDDNGAEHYQKMDLTLKVKRETHDIRIKSTTLNPTIACIGDKTDLIVKAENQGKRDEDVVTILVESPELNNYKDYKTFSLERYDGDNKKTVTFTIDTKNAKEGTYTLKIKAYYDDNLADYKEEKLTLQNCKKEENKTEEKPVAIIVEQKPSSQITGISTTPGTTTEKTSQTTTKEEKTTTDKTLLWLIIANIILAILVIIVILIILFK